MPDPTLQATALRFAANDLPPEEAATFGARLATDEAAQDALAEAVRLSAQALGQAPPAPRCSFRARVRERLGGVRRAHRGRAAAWAVLVACVAFAARGTNPPAPQPEVAGRPPPPPSPVTAPASEVVVAPEPTAADAPRTTAEIWADLSTPDHVEKAHDDEIERRQWMRDLRQPAGQIEIREPSPPG